MTIGLVVALALFIGGAGGFVIGRSTVQSDDSEDRKPKSAPLTLEQRCDEANGIWIDLEEAHATSFLDHLPNFARVPGCYRQIGSATTWILDLSSSGPQARDWARANDLTQEDIIRGF